MGRGAADRLGGPLLGEGARRRHRGRTTTSATSGATSSGWACSVRSRCSASSRGFAIATARSGYRARHAARDALPARRVRPLSRACRRLLVLLDALEDRAPAVGYTFCMSDRDDPGRGARRAHAAADRRRRRSRCSWSAASRSSSGRSRRSHAPATATLVINAAHLASQLTAAVGDGSALRRAHPLVASSRSRSSPPAASRPRCRSCPPGPLADRRGRRLDRLRLRDAAAAGGRHGARRCGAARPSRDGAQSGVPSGRRFRARRQPHPSRRARAG